MLFRTNRHYFLLTACAALTASLALGVQAEPTSPVTWDQTLYVTSTAAIAGDGSAAHPLKTIGEAFRIAADENHLSGGKSTRILIKPGIYRETPGTISAGRKDGGDDANANLPLQDAPLLIDRDGPAGQVVISGADDWSWAKGEGGEWTEEKDAHVPGGRVYSRRWTRNWGLWAGNLGSADIQEIAGQRREMVFLDRHDGRGAQPLAQAVLEKYEFSKVSDDGNPANWVGAGQWRFQGFAGLSALKPGSFGVCELGDTAEDGAAVPNSDINGRQDGIVIHRSPDEHAAKATVKLTFRQVYALHPYPAQLTNKIYLCLPAGVDIHKVGLFVSTRAEAFAIEGKKNLTLRHMTVEKFANPNYSNGAARIGRDIWNWRITTGNVQIEDCEFDDNNARALDLSGTTTFVVKRCRFIHNGGRGVSLTFTSNGLLRGCVIAGTGWRTETLGGGSSFAEAGVKTWRSDRLSFEDCRFDDNVNKGFYSDSAFRHGRFDGCTFRRNGYGTMHEIPGGPITYTHCRFQDNMEGISLLEAADVSIDQCVFLNNSVAAITANTKVRKDNPGGDTVLYAGDKNFGDDMNGGTIAAETISGFSLTHSVLASFLPGARLLRQSDDFSISSNWVKAMRDEAKYADNRYYLADSPYAFEDSHWFDDFPTWTAATHERGAVWGPPVGETAALPPPPAYAPGFTWKRANAWDKGSLPDTGGRILRDTNGQIAWQVCTTRGEYQGLTDPKPWYTRPLDTVNWMPSTHWDQLRYIQGASSPSYSRDSVSWMDWSDGEAKYLSGNPVIVWRNPTGKAAIVRVSGTMALSWFNIADQPMDVVVAVRRASGKIGPLLTQTVAHSAKGTAAVAVTGLEAVRVGPLDSLLFSAHIQQDNFNVNVDLKDDVTVTLVSEEK